MHLRLEAEFKFGRIHVKAERKDFLEISTVRILNWSGLLSID